MRVFGEERVGGLRGEGVRMGVGSGGDCLSESLLCDYFGDRLRNKRLFFDLSRRNV